MVKQQWGHVLNSVPARHRGSRPGGGLHDLLGMARGSGVAAEHARDNLRATPQGRGPSRRRHPSLEDGDRTQWYLGLSATLRSRSSHRERACTAPVDRRSGATALAGITGFDHYWCEGKPRPTPSVDKRCFGRALCAGPVGGRNVRRLSIGRPECARNTSNRTWWYSGGRLNGWAIAGGCSAAELLAMWRNGHQRYDAPALPIVLNGLIDPAVRQVQDWFCADVPRSHSNYGGGPTVTGARPVRAEPDGLSISWPLAQFRRIRPCGLTATLRGWRCADVLLIWAAWR
jgi:hypothetical protein